MGKCTTNTGCTSLVTSNCVIYTGSYLPNYSILSNTTLTDILKIIDKAKVDISSSVYTTNTNSIQLFGNGDHNNPLYGNVLISNNQNNNLSIVAGQGLYAPLQNLQSVTDTGNTTSNSILITASDNRYSAAGLQLYYNVFGYGVIESNDGSSLNRLDFLTSIANFNSTIVGITEPLAENSNKLASTAWVKQQNYITTETDPIAISKTVSITSGTGISVIGTTQTIGNNPQFVISAQSSSAIWNAASLQNTSISTAAPTSGQVLVYDGSQWTPGASSGGVGSVSITSPDLIVTGSPITSVGTINLELEDVITSGIYNNVTVSSKGLVVSGSNVSYLTSETDPTVPDIVKNITQVDIDNWNNAFDKFTTGIDVTGTTTKTITITLNDSSVVQAAFTDDNNYPTAISYNNVTGDFTLSRNGLSALTANLTDDRYALKATTILATGNGITGGGDLSANRSISLDFSYLDDRYLGGYKQRAAVRTATTGNITLSGSQAIDGITLSDGDRVLVKNQTNGAENGIYTYNSSGSWTRATDFDQATTDEISQGSQIFVQEGTINAKTGWSLSSAEPYTIGTTPLVFIQYAGANSYIAGTGLTLTGNQFSAQNTSAIWNASQIRGVNVSSTSPTTNQILRYDGTNWTPFSSSIGLSMPSIFSVSNSPLNLTGTFSVSLANQNANLVFAGPSSGAAAVPTFRALTATDIPLLDAAKITSGVFPVSRGGTGLSSLGTPLQILRVNSGGSALEYFSPNFLTSNQNITLSGDVTGSGATSITTTIVNNSVTYAKMQDITASRLIGRYASTTGDPQEITIGSGLSLNAATGVLSTTSSGSGTVTSVGLSLPSLFSVSGSPVTTSGTLTASLISQSANLVFASPNGASGTPTFRAIVNNDLPNSGVAIGTYNTLTVNSKGIVTSATNTSYVPTGRTLTITAGTGISVSPSTSQDLSTNRTWTITNTGVTSVNGNTGDITVAPASGSGNYIQNQTAANQTANFRIAGSGAFVKNGSNSFSSTVSLYNTSFNRGANLQLTGDTTPGLGMWIHDGSVWQERMRVLSNGNVGIGTTIPGTKLEVAGQVKITGGSPGFGKVLTSDSVGLANWQSISDISPYTPKTLINYVSIIGNTAGSIETDLAAYNTGTSTDITLNNLGDRYVATYSGSLGFGASVILKFYFGSTTNPFFTTGTITTSGVGYWTAEVEVMRYDSGVRETVTVTVSSSTGKEVYVVNTDEVISTSGVNRILRMTGTSSTANNITLRAGTIVRWPGNVPLA